MRVRIGLLIIIVLTISFISLGDQNSRTNKISKDNSTKKSEQLIMDTDSIHDKYQQYSQKSDGFNLFLIKQ